MNRGIYKPSIGLWLAFSILLLSPSLPRVSAQWMPVPPTPDAQRNALGIVRSQVRSLQNATRTADNFAAGGDAVVWQQFQSVRGAFNQLTATLNPRQAAEGANEMAELAAGLDIIQEAFGNYQDDVANGRSPGAALNDMCQVIHQASDLWLQELNRDCARLGVGR